MNTSDTKTLREYDRAHVWHPFTQMKEWEESDPVVIVRGEGTWIVDSEGNRYLDGVAAIWTNVHGHCKREINEAIKAQVDTLEHSTLLGLANDKAVLLARRLVEIAPPGLCKVFYSDNGSTAVEISVKMAFQYWQHQGKPEKTKFISFKNAYHGDTIGAVSVGGIDLYHAVFRPLLFPTIQAPAPYCYRCEFGERDRANCGMRCLKELERLMEIHAHEVAGLVIEPLVQGAGGMIVQPDGFVRRVRELCDRYDILMIADEVAVGFGRTGAMFACEREGITPDIMALSKGITAGYLPLAATMTTQKIYDAFIGEYREMKTFFHGHTFTGNPIACAAALASLDLFENERLLDSLTNKIGYLAERLQALNEVRHVGEVRQCGMIAGIELVKDAETREPFPWEERVGIQVCLEARNRGIFLRPLGNIIVVFPPLSISLDELAFLMDGIEASIRAITELRT
ncbi:adenosylmethionine-8-amino-7-oxononanoate aminotransferase [Geobacter metallireducens RCH3]|uniref:Adenosylmethionine-8-amino-7-oxononanoate aminotransferase n=1 Tax=Geobacter metallireducens (strain ATCC 53774 / DSM 7210 / GS-15) TaxID=269799 RepID=Q39VB2_GEOMG|nr:adenosylmethionine--8-amino-7-oxononanoate transaminase [Geobacter metallireducens]ABB31812.1 lysine--8-amino-7-oxononanoate aminotransferase [Geobacter metallireducens GS-15]EHP89306.1 adenosylmethionine-8-amino-7-oxononanoate aminotransferase [Geobacter metallireducens RCH3]